VPARSRFGPPLEQMLWSLRAARERGLSFDEAWSRALQAPSHRDAAGVYLGHQTVKRREWIMVLEATRAEWEAAFEGRETSLSRTVRRVVEEMVQDASRAVVHPTAEVPPMARLSPIPMPYVGGPEVRRRELVDVFEAAA
jgi:hypothetical protein